ncbi:heme exporter protein CcmD [Vibrio parahaemolyticus]|jgi:heme exporter protein D|uniref:Heme exporter protein D n=2 Tax=Vibrio parahaemolyticus TaxID=670 RepID=A0A072LJZ5_VIBPH|nr:MULTISPECIES: heme exporter protein CcmD [Vibrio]EFO38485.1 putative heme exporter protein CcmD [Vibrio parahaemolyticus Peru-466]EFO44883.1 putative heme exporter protein CcmD [Vibrio parahaemolyticus AQ4037]EFO53009.1 conserved domain protein [Vibrio parahaemolyticus K5030]EJG0762355.1 heme exporter protein CcmD [Vibrio parahaemolyticus O5:K30]EJG0872801.1 heme exporter protein CcmD [Vibrio parahaemolyticus O3]EJG0901459.1 heme exporter protein CcmD [Vibrio parahaemolyticus O3:K56]EJG09
MHFESLSDFFAMGGYASYVWSAFGITFLSMLILLITSLRRGDALMKEVKAKIDRQARIDAAKNMENTL